MASGQHFRPPGPLGFGGAPLGNMFQAISDDQAHATLEAAWDAGYRYFDTAPHYGSGLSEHRFGEMLRTKPRDDFVLSTKAGRLLEPVRTPPESIFKNPLPFEGCYDYSADGVLRSVEDSYQRLGLSQIDIVYIHDIAADHHGDAWTDQFAIAMEGAKALTRLREEGVIKAWGLGVNLVEPCLRALEQADPDVFLLAGRYSLLDLGGLDDLFPACLDRGVSVVVGGPFNSGLLAGGTTFDYAEAPDEKVEARQRLQAIAVEHGVDLRAAALQFCAAHPAVSAVIPGTKSAERARDNMELVRTPVPEAFWETLRAQGVLPEHAPTP
ncbi:aldo/keto reductase [Aurantimonas sp. MSK8Z-1]|uniref:aldo/keto reductase n=1 Tax=Mangrovibrevibacter kandeliae TaxID=2968473 RepID=UPI002119643C|nr:aldo/keto reductase [Aurantimonas sp. MSK8Z-1]MCW4116630.1 aldo/keto reductase [Aurantimonas sp. MSK8Z-1]